MEKIIINGKGYESFAEAYNTGMYSYLDLDGVETFDDVAGEWFVDFPDGSWVWVFNFKKNERN